MTTRNRQKIERIHDMIPMENVLAFYGYRVQPGADGREQQFPCDLHGDGSDNRPSARAYEDHMFCWACGVARDAIDLVQIKESATFRGAVRILEERYQLPPMPWPDMPGGADEKQPNALDEINATLQVSTTYEKETKRLQALMSSLTEERILPMRVTLRFWSIFDKVAHKVKAEEITDGAGMNAMSQLRGRIMERIQR